MLQRLILGRVLYTRRDLFLTVSFRTLLRSWTITERNFLHPVSSHTSSSVVLQTLQLLLSSLVIVEIKSIDLCVLYVITIRMFLMELGYNQQSAISNKNIYRFTAFFRYSEERTDNRQSTVYQCKDTFHSRVSAVRSSHL